MHKTLLAATFLFVACPPPVLNTPCTLRYSDGGPIPESLARELTLGTKDFVYIGAVECEELFCVRDATFGRLPDGGYDETSPDAGARGYCSKACQGNDCRTGIESDDQPGNPRRMTCRSLVLNEQLLSDPTIRSQLKITTSLFCARGQQPDAG
jgi:hypothetical protein